MASNSQSRDAGSQDVNTNAVQLASAPSCSSQEIELSDCSTEVFSDDATERAFDTEPYGGPVVYAGLPDEIRKLIEEAEAQSSHQACSGTEIGSGA